MERSGLTKLSTSRSIILQIKNSRLYRESVKKGNEKYFNNISNVQELISSKLQEYVNDYTKKYEFPIMFDEGYTLLRYTGGQEYKAHCDYAPHMPRYLSALILPESIRI